MDSLDANDLEIQKAVQLLNKGEVVGMPTETVFGLAASIQSETGLKKIFHVKERPFFDPLIVHVSSIQQARSCVKEWPEVAQVLAEHFWPGPLTLVLEKNESISDLITSGLTTVGLRWPRHQVAQQLIQKLGHPVAAPSANKFGKTSPTNSSHVKDEFKDEVFVLSGQASDVGIESTIVLIQNNSIKNLSILRKGLITQDQIQSVISKKFTSNEVRFTEQVSEVMAPGKLKHHYMPHIPLVLVPHNSKWVHEKIPQILSEVQKRINNLPDQVQGVSLAEIKLKAQQKTFEKAVLLKLPQDATLAARALYNQLRQLDKSGGDVILGVLGPEMSGPVWDSILDRLYKAASIILE